MAGIFGRSKFQSGGSCTINYNKRRVTRDKAGSHQHQQQQQQQSYVSLIDTEPLNPLQPSKKRSFLPPLPPLSSSLSSTEHARKMGETHHRHGAPTPSTSSRMAMRAGGGEIVEVQGGHIVRSTGRKDRHSKVCTAKGPRDRRVRLSAHTAIQFYDVQDRLGYDRPSKAVDWLIKKAKVAIDQLAELPAWKPSVTCASTMQQQQQHHVSEVVHHETTVGDSVIASSSRRVAATTTGSFGRIPEQFHHQQLGENNADQSNNNNNNGKYNSGSGFLPASLDTDNIADTIKSFFPMEATTSFQNYQPPAPPDLLSRTSGSGGAVGQQDLRLSLQSFQDPILLHHQPEAHHEPVLYAGTTAALNFDGGGSAWSEQQQQHNHSEEQRLHRAMAWNANAADAGNTGYGGGFVFNSPGPAMMFGHGQFLSQRGPLQSSNTPSFRAWIDPSMATTVAIDHQNHYFSPLIHQASVSGGFSAAGGFSGFRVPARIQGEEEHDGVSDKPSSASSDSRH
ncbi:hypothetical protein RJT34_02204 [Clitoria ternatea]|uniref:TCP domain-containing protein n=1 Tax=Clitoria ternatea TaxID=43366 RepID=A0AAN9Q1K7_CLITE